MGAKTNGFARGRYWSLLLAAISTATLNGCASTIDAVSDSQDSRILNADSVQGPRDDRGPVKTFERRIGLEPCHPEDQEASRLRDGTLGTTSKACSTYKPASNSLPPNSFFGLQVKSEQAAGETGAARQYLAAGIALSNEVCRIWFSDLGRAHTTLRETSDTVSGVGTLTAVLLDVTRVARPGATLAASIFGFTKSSIDNLDANYIVAADLPTVKDAVERHRGKYAKEIEQYSGDWNYYTARRVIMAYDNTCSTLAVSQFIKTKIAGGSVAGAAVAANADLTQALAADVQKIISGHPDLTNDALVNLYAYYVTLGPNDDLAVKNEIFNNLKMQLPSGAIDDAKKDVKFVDPTRNDAALTVDKAAPLLAAAAKSEKLTEIMGGLASDEIAKWRTKLATQTPNNAVLLEFMNYDSSAAAADAANAAVAPAVGAPPASAPQPDPTQANAPKKMGWDDIFTVHGVEDDAIHLYILLSGNFTAVSPNIKTQISDTLKTFRDSSTGKFRTKANKTESDFMTAVRDSTHYANLDDYLLAKGKIMVVGLAPKDPAVSPAKAVENQVNNSAARVVDWSMPLTSDGRSLDVPPPVSGSE